MPSATIVQNGNLPSTATAEETAASCHSLPVVQINSPLLRLPAELRNMIYAYTLGGNTWSINMGHPKPRADNGTPHALALLQVNHQIYAEASLFPYPYNTFEGRHNGHLRTFISSLSPTQRASIQTIKCHQRGYIIQGVRGLEVSPIFWMDTPNMRDWELVGLKRIEVEVVLNQWRWDSDAGETEAAKMKALTALKNLVEERHPDVKVAVALKRGY